MYKYVESSAIENTLKKNSLELIIMLDDWFDVVRNRELANRVHDLYLRINPEPSYKEVFKLLGIADGLDKEIHEQYMRYLDSKNVKGENMDHYVMTESQRGYLENLLNDLYSTILGCGIEDEEDEECNVDSLLNRITQALKFLIVLKG